MREIAGNDNVDNLVADNIVAFGGPRDEGGRGAAPRTGRVLRQEHRDLDSAIDALETMSTSDKLQLQRLKKPQARPARPDQFRFSKDRLNPDIIA